MAERDGDEVDKSTREDLENDSDGHEWPVVPLGIGYAGVAYLSEYDVILWICVAVGVFGLLAGLYALSELRKAPRQGRTVFTAVVLLAGVVLFPLRLLTHVF